MLVLFCTACKLRAVVPLARGSAPRRSVLLLSWLGEVAPATRLSCVHSAALSRDSADLSVPRKASAELDMKERRLGLAELLAAFPALWVALSLVYKHTPSCFSWLSCRAPQCPGCWWACWCPSLRLSSCPLSQTTLAHIIANNSKKHGIRFVTLSATSAKTTDVRDVIKQAQNEKRFFKRKTILFIDEIHRFNKSQQVRALPSGPCECGLECEACAVTAQGFRVGVTNSPGAQALRPSSRLLPSLFLSIFLVSRKCCFCLINEIVGVSRGC